MIKIDMEMPKSCRECLYYDVFKGYNYCNLLDESIGCEILGNKINTQRHSRCPLQELESEDEIDKLEDENTRLKNRIEELENKYEREGYDDTRY